MTFDIVTIFPGFFAGPFDHGVLSRARKTGLVDIATHDLRAFTHDRHRTVDDRPFGGGEGMVLKPEPIVDCFDTLGIGTKPGAPPSAASSLRVGLRDLSRETVILLSAQGRPFTQSIAAELATLGISPKAERDTTKETVVLLSAQGAPFTQSIAHELAAADRVVFLCGRYEGIDERINDLLCDRELSIGDYVLSGGELAAAVIIDAVVRLLPGVLGNPDSIRNESFGAESESPQSLKKNELGPDGVPLSTHLAGGLLDYPHYTRPADFRGIEVPAVLLGGDHAAIRRWRRERALEKTFRNRPELLANAPLTDADRRFLASLQKAPTL